MVLSAAVKAARAAVKEAAVKAAKTKKRDKQIARQFTKFKKEDARRVRLLKDEATTKKRVQRNRMIDNQIKEKKRILSTPEGRDNYAIKDTRSVSERTWNPRRHRRKDEHDIAYLDIDGTKQSDITGPYPSRGKDKFSAGLGWSPVRALSEEEMNLYGRSHKDKPTSWNWFAPHGDLTGYHRRRIFGPDQ
jgi:hypothetical protein